MTLITVVAVGAVLAFLIIRGQRGQGGGAVLQSRLEEAQARLAEKEAELERLRAQLGEGAVARAKAEERAEQARLGLEEQRRTIAEMEGKLKDSFRALSAEALKENIDAFLKLAGETMDKRHGESAAELEKRRAAIEEMVKPLNQRLGEIRDLSEHLGRERREGEGSLKAMLEGMAQEQARLRDATATLTNALNNNQTRGDWGEMVLERLLEWSGMKAGIHFEKQRVSEGDENRRLKPDFVVHLPGNRDLIIDSKAVFGHFVDASRESDPVRREGMLKLHAQMLRDQVGLLARKEYHRHVGGNPVEFTVLFLPSDPALAAALQTDEKLFEKANKENIILASPNTLMALLKVVEKGWRDAEMAQNAQKIAAAGKDLMNRFRVFWDHLGSLRRGLGGAVKAYNDAVGSLDRSVLPGTRKLMEMGVQGDRKMSNTLPPEDMPLVEEPRAVPAPPAGGEEPFHLTPTQGSPHAD